MRKIKSFTAILFVALFVFACVSCGQEQTDLWKDAKYKENTSLGQGNITFNLEVCAEDKTVLFTVSTNEQILGNALLSLGLIEGEDGPYGLYIKKVNGILADHDVDQTYWAFYINGEYAMAGVDGTEIVNGATYKLCREK